MTRKDSPTRLRRELASLLKQKQQSPHMFGSTRPSISFLGQAFCDKSLSIQKAGLDMLTPDRRSDQAGFQPNAEEGACILQEHSVIDSSKDRGRPSRFHGKQWSASREPLRLCVRIEDATYSIRNLHGKCPTKWFSRAFD